jgi:hypothetical protein
MTTLLPARSGIAQELGELAGADHGCLINYHHGVTIEPFGPSPELTQQAVDRGGGRVGLAFQLAGGRPGRRRTDHLQPATAERIHGGAGGVGLAGAGIANDQRDPGAVASDLAHHRLLIGVQAGPGLEGGADVLAGDHRGALAGAPFGLLDQASLQSEELRGGVAGLIQAPVHGDQDRSLGSQELVGQVLEGGEGPVG